MTFTAGYYRVTFTFRYRMTNPHGNRVRKTVSLVGNYTLQDENNFDKNAWIRVEGQKWIDKMNRKTNNQLGYALLPVTSDGNRYTFSPVRLYKPHTKLDIRFKLYFSTWRRSNGKWEKEMHTYPIEKKVTVQNLSSAHTIAEYFGKEEVRRMAEQTGYKREFEKVVVTRVGIHAKKQGIIIKTSMRNSLKLFKGHVAHTATTSYLFNPKIPNQKNKNVVLVEPYVSPIVKYVLADIPSQIGVIPQGFQLWVRFVFSDSKYKDDNEIANGVALPKNADIIPVVNVGGDEHVEKYYSKSFEGVDINEDHMKQVITKMTGQNYESEDYKIYFIGYEMIYKQLPAAGGCSSDKCVEDIILGFKNKKRPDKLVLVSPKSKNNNCLPGVLNMYFGLTGNVMKADAIRKKLGFPLNTLIHYTDIPTWINYYNKKTGKDVGWRVINELDQILLLNEKEENIIIVLKDSHYFLGRYHYHVKCKKCGAPYPRDKDHVCNPQKMSFFQKKICKKHVVRSNKIAEKEKLDYSTVVYWDLETFPDPATGKHVPYASGYELKGEYKQHYGQNSIEATIDDFVGLEDSIITAYNGSSFDFYFLIDKLTQRGVKIQNTILSNGKLMGFRYGSNKVFDLYLFLMSSLDGACKSFNIKNQKSEFNHLKIKTWEDVETYRQEVEPYLKIDVLALKELFESFNDTMYDLFKANITSYVTLSHMGYEIWGSRLENVVTLPDTIEKYDFIKSATYGGRCGPLVKESISANYDEVCQKEMSYEELLESNNFIFNADVSSLYPAAMRGNDLVECYYPVGVNYWSDKPKEEFDAGRLGFYKVKYRTKKDIMIPINPRKKYTNGVAVGVEWSLYNGEGIYTSVDIQNMLDAGYKIEFIDKCLVWKDKSKDVFSKYIDTFYKIKADAEKEGNKVLRSVAKLFLNGLYGKTLQKAIFKTTEIVNSGLEFEMFIQNHDLTDWAILNENKLLLSGEVKNHVEKITKPCQLGAFVTAYSRRFMLFFMKAIDPTLKTPVYTYTDTDSLHIYGPAYKKLKELGYILPKSEAKLGYLTNDIDNEGLIIFERNLAPKTYRYEYINNKGEVMTNDKGVMKGKGIPKKTLTENGKKDILKAEFYDDDCSHQIEFGSLKKISKNVTNNQKERGISHFSIVNVKQTRTFHKSSWEGYDLMMGVFYPKNFQGKYIE